MVSKPLVPTLRRLVERLRVVKLGFLLSLEAASPPPDKELGPDWLLTVRRLSARLTADPDADRRPAAPD